jgi:hypothetical protein
MSSQSYARVAAVVGILGGLSAIGGGLYAHFQSPQPVFGIPSFLFVYSDYLSGVHALVGLGVIMVIGGFLGFKWPALGIGIVCAGALIGLISVYDRGRPPFMGDSLRTRWMPYFYYWSAPWVLAWISGIFGGLSLQKSVKQYDSPADIDNKVRAPQAG